MVPLSPIPSDLTPSGRLDCIPKAILYDIYGTVLISGTGDISLASLQNEAIGISEILESSGFPPLLPDMAAEKIPELMDRFIRDTHTEARNSGTDHPEVEIRDIWRQVLKVLWDEGLLESDPESRNVEELALAHELSVNPVWPMPGFPEAVTAIAASGTKTGIVSNAQFYTPLILEALSGTDLESIGFDSRLCTWSYRQGCAKPSPTMFSGPLSVLASEGIEASETLYVGNDMLNDIAAASRAGCMTALFAGDRRSLRMREGDEKADRKPDAIITRLEQLNTIISGGSLDDTE